MTDIRKEKDISKKVSLEKNISEMDLFFNNIFWYYIIYKIYLLLINKFL